MITPFVLKGNWKFWKSLKKYVGDLTTLPTTCEIGSPLAVFCLPASVAAATTETALPQARTAAATASESPDSAVFSAAHTLTSAYLLHLSHTHTAFSYSCTHFSLPIHPSTYSHAQHKHALPVYSCVYACYRYIYIRLMFFII